jgi:uncharacterized protein YjeT (DUF2065 family)
MKYLLAAIAGIWMADGLALLVAPQHVIARVREVLVLSPQELHYRLLWTIMGLTMLVKGLFLALGPDQWRHHVLQWCLRREEVDYRFWGLGLCTLAILLLHALGWVGSH